MVELARSLALSPVLGSAYHGQNLTHVVRVAFEQREEEPEIDGRACPLRLQTVFGRPDVASLS